MEHPPQSAVLLLAEDDDDDFLLVQEALQESRVLHELYRVKDGEEAMNFLLRRGPYQKPQAAPTPALILLDLNMPRKDGHEVLREIKSNPALRHIPVVILTTSKAEADIVCSYDLGVNSFIRKPGSFQGLVGALQALTHYWFKIVELPTKG